MIMVNHLLLCADEDTYQRTAEGPVDITIIHHSFKLNRDKTIPQNIWKRVSMNMFWKKQMTAKDMETLLVDPTSGDTKPDGSSTTQGFSRRLRIIDDDDSDDD